MNVTVFGGAHASPGEAIYEHGMRLGKLLAEAGCTVLTGGYIGTMEAVSRGAAEAGAHVIGVTCDEIERWRPLAPNSWVKEERRFQTLHERLLALINGCEAAIALPGGVGTLAEISLMWNRLIVNSMQPRPLILVGKGWQTVFANFFEALGPYIAEKDRNYVSFVEDVDQAVREIRKQLPPAN